MFVKADEAVKVIKIHKGIDIYQEVYSGFGGRDLERFFNSDLFNFKKNF